MPTWTWDTATRDMRCASPCGLCGKPSVGIASINGTPYCHGNHAEWEPSCYESAQKIIARRDNPGAFVWLDDIIAALEAEEGSP